MEEHEHEFNPQIPCACGEKPQDYIAQIECERKELRAALEGLKWNDVPGYGSCFCMAGTIPGDDMHADYCVDANAALKGGK